MSQKQCQECGQSFEPRRIDQKFCDVKCKNQFNNRDKKERFQGYKMGDQICIEINKTLMQNREILKKFDGQKIELKNLQQMGFNENYFTNIERVEVEKKVIYVCYDIAFHFLSEEKIKIYSPQKL